MQAGELEYALPPEAVAQEPVEPRHDARLLVEAVNDDEVQHRRVRDLPACLRPGDLAWSTTRAWRPPAYTSPSDGGQVEVLVTNPRPSAGGRGAGAARASRAAGDGAPDAAGPGRPVRSAPDPDGRRQSPPLAHAASRLLLDELGEVPLPP